MISIARAGCGATHSQNEGATTPLTEDEFRALTESIVSNEVAREDLKERLSALHGEAEQLALQARSMASLIRHAAAEEKCGDSISVVTSLIAKNVDRLELIVELFWSESDALIKLQEVA